MNTAVTGLGAITADLDVLSGGAWSEPPSPYAAEYPYNHVYESESGHVKEFDDTAGAERIHERHTSGTGYEIGPAGTKVTKVVKDKKVFGEIHSKYQGPRTKARKEIRS